MTQEELVMEKTKADIESTSELTRKVRIENMEFKKSIRTKFIGARS